MTTPTSPAAPFGEHDVDDPGYQANLPWCPETRGRDLQLLHDAVEDTAAQVDARLATRSRTSP
jgi:hypothetical protein